MKFCTLIPPREIRRREETIERGLGEASGHKADTPVAAGRRLYLGRDLVVITIIGLIMGLVALGF